MKTFDFAKTTASLSICGQVYVIDCGCNKTVAALTEFAESCEALSQAGNEAAFTKGTPAMEKLLESVLGERAVNEIFAGRGRNWNDLYDLCMFVCDAINEARNADSTDRIKNRAQRRSANQKRGSHKIKQQKAARQTPSFSDLSQPERERILAFGRDAIARGDIILGNEYRN